MKPQSALLELGQRIARREAARPSHSFQRLERAALGHGDLTLSDRDLAVAALEAVRRDQILTAQFALEELTLRLAADEPAENVERAA